VTDGNGRVRVAAVKTGTFYGQEMTAGHIYTISTIAEFGSPDRVTVAPSGTGCGRYRRHGTVSL
jgi:hypothetical protein